MSKTIDKGQNSLLKQRNELRDQLASANNTIAHLEAQLTLCKNVIDRARFVDEYRTCFYHGIQPGESDTDDCMDLGLTWLHKAPVVGAE